MLAESVLVIAVMVSPVTASYDLDHENWNTVYDRTSGQVIQVGPSSHSHKHHGRVLTEDGTYVPPGYYAQRAGPTKAVCDYLGKTIVFDSFYGTRCV